MFRMMAERSGDVMLNISVDGHIRYVSPLITKLGGFEPADLIGRSALIMVHPDDRIVASAAHGRALSRPEESFSYQYRGLKKSGDVIWMETQTRASVDDGGRVLGVISAARNIAQRKSAEDKLINAANTDVLTGLANRRIFDEQLHRAVHATKVRSHSGCVAILDIDFFKRVNDTHGHPAGDQVLKDVAAVLQPTLRSGDTIARIGGEEFGLILWDLRIEDADALCERLRETIEGMSIKVGSLTIGVTVSIGLADIDAYATVPDLLAAADAALYRAKTEGRNCLRLAA
jgi:diguanylate cyclase (GGDEF)-like protein/PAS domain S-box-containing protein